MTHWVDSHFGCFDDDDALVASGEPDTSGAEFGLDPLSLTVLGLGAFGATAAAVHHTLAAHQLIHGIRNGHTMQVAKKPRVGMAILDSDHELEALQEAAHTDPYALGQPL
jgi:hypothetical protein